MAKSSVRRASSSKKSNLNSKFWIKFSLISLLFFGLIFSIFHYKNALLYYFSFKTDKIVKQDKFAAARIQQLLKKHDDKIVGFDISEYQGDINWEEVNSIQDFKLHFVFIRATAGTDKKDYKFKENWSKANEYKFIRGAYHYYRPNENSVEQAKNFVKNVRLSKGDLPPVLDIEKLPETQSIDSLKVGLKRWLQYVDKHYKIKPIIYSGESYYKDFLKDEFSEYPLWIANYNPWRESMEEDWHFWQFTEKGVIRGINTPVDINIYNGTPKMLGYLTKSH